MTEFNQLLNQIKKDIKRLDELAKGDRKKETVLLGEKIKMHRKANRLTQEDLARKLYVTKMCVIKWETGRSTPSGSSMQRLNELGIR